MRGDVERQPHRAVDSSHHLTAHQSLGCGHLGGSVSGKSEDARQEEDRLIGGLPGLRKVDMVNGAHRSVRVDGHPILELVNPRRRQPARRRSDPEDLGPVRCDGAAHRLLGGIGASVRGRSHQILGPPGGGGGVGHLQAYRGDVWIQIASLLFIEDDAGVAGDPQ